MAILVLISGSNNSGKSIYAEQLIAKTIGKRYYIATMRPCTEDNHRRIKKHRAQRQGLGFDTIESPYQVGNAPVSSDGVVLLEDVSNLLTLLITGGIHMDGYMDTVDALASHQSRECKLEILKDPNSFISSTDRRQ